MPHPRFRRTDTNQYQTHLYDALAAQDVEVVRFDRTAIRRGRIDVLHIHWPEYYAGGRSPRVYFRRYSAVLSDLVAVRVRKIAVVWTAHNLRPHDWRGRLHERLYWFVFRGQLDGALFLSAASREAALELHPELARIPHRIAPHGVYTELAGNDLLRSDARARLELPGGARLATVVGAIRRYKRASQLARTFLHEPRHDVELVIAGNVWEDDLRHELRSLADDGPGIHLRLDLLTDEEFAAHLAAADVVVIPQKTVHNSGVAMAALSARRPVIMGDSPSARELRSLVGAAWVGIVPDLPTPEMVDDFLASREVDTESPGPDLTAFQWDHIAEITRALYEEAMLHARRRRPARR